MTDDSYMSLHYHIVNLQKKSGAMLVTEDEMEKRFADAQRAEAFAASEDEDDELFGATTEFLQPETALGGAAAAAAATATATAAATATATAKKSDAASVPLSELATEEIIMMSEDQINDSEIIKKRRMSIFSRLKTMLRDGEEDTEPEVTEPEVDEPKVTYEEEPAVTMKSAKTPLEETYFDDEEDDLEGATTEFISPFTSERDAIAASEMQATEVFDSVVFSAVEDSSPEEEMLENRMENTEDLLAYEPKIDEYEEYEEEEPAEFVPEEPEEEILEGESEGEGEFPEDSQIIDAFCADPIEDHADVPKHIFEDTTLETQETVLDEEEEETDNYVSFDQNPEVFQEYKRKYNSVRVRMGISGFLAVLLLVFENIGIFGIQLPEFMRHEAFTVPFEWTVLFICGVLSADVIWGALKKLVHFNFEPASVTLIAFVLSCAATLTALFTESEPKFYNFPFALCVFINLLSVYFSLRKEIFSFKIVSASKKKHAVTLMSADEAAPEAEMFAENISEKSQFYRVGEAEFVNGYFAKRKQVPGMYKKLRVVLPLAFLAACAAAVVAIVLKNAGVYEGLVTGYLTFMMCAPVAVFFANELPMYFSAVNAYSHNSAILGDSAPEMMENMSSVSFPDKDVFMPGDGVRIKGVKVIDNNRIDNIIHYATSVFDLVGGPLAKVFKQAALDDVLPESSEIRVVSSKGIDATVDGKHIVLGVYEYMEMQCFNPVREAGDEKWEGKTNKRVLYLACNEEIIAKFYIEYTVNPEFVYIVKKLSKAGVCVAVRTSDPCIDKDLFAKQKLDSEQYHFGIIKGAGSIEEKEHVAASKTGLVAAGSLKGLIKTILVCDRLRNVQRTNFVIKTIAAAIGLLTMGFLIGMGVSVFGAWSLYFALYQLLWLVPVYIVSKIYI